MKYVFLETEQGEVCRVQGGSLGPGVHETVEEYPDSTVTHRFTVGKTVKEEGEYSWYAITNHSRVIDRTKALAEQLKEQADALCELAGLIV